MENFNSSHATSEDIKKIKILEKNLVQNPKDYKSWLEKAILLYEPLHQTDEAIKLMQALIERDPENVDARFWLAEFFFDHYALYEESEKLLSEALAINPDRADCHRLYASVLESLRGDSEKIIFHYRKAIKLEPSWPAQRLFLANFLFKQGKLLESRREVLEALPHLLENIPETNDSIKSHYERIITGRYNKTMKKTLLNFLEEIDAAIKKSNN